MGKTRCTVKWFNARKGFGFLLAEDPKINGDIFVHYSNIETTGFKSLHHKDIVECIVNTNEKGEYFATAVNIKE
jgi:CspA family cold shock protein